MASPPVVDSPTLFDTAAPQSADDPQLRLVVLSGSRASEVYEVNEPLVVGRGAEVNLRLVEPNVSRSHARFARGPSGQLYVEDLGSRNGTHVNGERVERRLLKLGDRVHVGPGVVFLVTVHDQLEEQRLQTKKLEVIGRLSGGIAHDFNNLLAAIVANVHFLKRVPDPEPELLQECLGEILTAAQQGADLTSQLLGYARQGRYEESVVRLDELVAEVLGMLRRTIDPSVELLVDVAPDLSVRGDRTQLTHVLMNLCVNARDAMMPGGGRLWVSVARKQADHEGRGFAVITVRDEGHGMPPETQERIFEPFFTTKGRGGTGLGLASAYGIIERHGGLIEVDSVEGVGTSFRVYLRTHEPLADAVPQLPQHISRDEIRLLGSNLRVLLVDDEDLVRSSTARLLRGEGMTVVDLADGRAALEIIAEPGRRFDLAVIDWLMPGMGGGELLPLLRARDHNLPVLVVTGYSDQDQLREAVAGDPLCWLLRKPFSRAELVGAVRVAFASLG